MKKNGRPTKYTEELDDKIANDLKEDKERYEQQLLELTANDKSFELDATTLLWVAQHARELYKSLKVEQKTRFLNILLSNLKIQQKNGSSISVRAVCEPGGWL